MPLQMKTHEAHTKKEKLCKIRTQGHKQGAQANKRTHAFAGGGLGENGKNATDIQGQDNEGDEDIQAMHDEMTEIHLLKGKQGIFETLVSRIGDHCTTVT